MTKKIMYMEWKGKRKKKKNSHHTHHTQKYYLHRKNTTVT